MKIDENTEILKVLTIETSEQNYILNLEDEFEYELAELVKTLTKGVKVGEFAKLSLHFMKAEEYYKIKGTLII
jgi:hypothetical protein